MLVYCITTMRDSRAAERMCLWQRPSDEPNWNAISIHKSFKSKIDILWPSHCYQFSFFHPSFVKLTSLENNIWSLFSSIIDRRLNRKIKKHKNDEKKSKKNLQKLEKIWLEANNSWILSTKWCKFHGSDSHSNQREFPSLLLAHSTRLVLHANTNCVHENHQVRKFFAFLAGVLSAIGLRFEEKCATIGIQQHQRNERTKCETFLISKSLKQMREDVQSFNRSCSRLPKTFPSASSVCSLFMKKFFAFSSAIHRIPSFAFLSCCFKLSTLVDKALTFSGENESTCSWQHRFWMLLHVVETSLRWRGRIFYWNSTRPLLESFELKIPLREIMKG